MKKMNKFLLTILMTWGCILAAAAEIHVEVSGGQASGIPIAVVPFSLEGADKHDIEDIAGVVQSDLNNSGQFAAIPTQTMQQFPTQGSQVQYAYWQGVGADDLIIGRIQKTGSLRFRVNFELLDVFKQKANDGSSAPLLAMQFEDVHAHEFRALAHHISDLIFEKLIGVRGVFSTRIAYISVIPGTKGDIHTLEIADSDGHNPKSLYRSSFPLMSPAWSWDAKKIAFVSFDKDRQSVNVVDVNTGKVQKITQFPGINSAPSWSPDNRSLALVLSKEGNPKLYIADLASKQLTRLTDGTSIDTEPCFTPDGRSVVFTSNRSGKPQIYKIDLGSRKIDRLTFAGDYNAKPSLTPDGKRLVMMHRGDDGLFNIAVQPLQGGELKLLTRSSLSDSPSVAPNGMMVLYGIEESGRGVLGAVSLDGRIKIRLPAGEGNVQSPAWAPFPFSKF